MMLRLCAFIPSLKHRLGHKIVVSIEFASEETVEPAGTVGANRAPEVNVAPARADALRS